METLQQPPMQNEAECQQPAPVQRHVFTVRELKIFAFNLNERVQHTRVRKVSGFERFKRSVGNELRKLQEMSDDSKEYSSTNIFYLTAIWNYCTEIGLNNVQSVCKTIKFFDDEQDKKCHVVVDIICHHKLKWVKMKSKNPYSIQVQILKSDSARSNILMVAEKYIKAAKCNKIKFKTPKIEMIFTKGIASDVAFMLKTKGVTVRGQVIEENIFFEDDVLNQDLDQDSKSETNHKDDHKEDSEGKDADDEELVNNLLVNLGPKTLMTLISAMANNELHEEFWQIVENYIIQREDNPKSYKSSIYQQALNFSYNVKVPHKLMGYKSTEALSAFVGSYYEEIQYPVTPIILQYIGGRQLICCASAWQSVSKLVGLGAGPNELARYNQLSQQITVVPDQISERTKRLSGKGLSAVNRAVFGTGDSLKVLTVAGAPSFVRRARQQGVDYYCKLHDVRPFVEQYQRGFDAFKMKKAFDVEELQRVMAADDVNLNFDDDDDDDSDSEDGSGGIVIEESEIQDDEQHGVIELNEEFEHFEIAEPDF